MIQLMKQGSPALALSHANPLFRLDGLYHGLPMLWRVFAHVREDEGYFVGLWPAVESDDAFLCVPADNWGVSAFADLCSEEHKHEDGVYLCLKLGVYDDFVRVGTEEEWY